MQANPQADARLPYHTVVMSPEGDVIEVRKYTIINDPRLTDYERQCVQPPRLLNLKIHTDQTQPYLWLGGHRYTLAYLNCLAWDRGFAFATETEVCYHDGNPLNIHMDNLTFRKPEDAPTHQAKTLVRKAAGVARLHKFWHWSRYTRAGGLRRPNGGRPTPQAARACAAARKAGIPRRTIARAYGISDADLRSAWKYVEDPDRIKEATWSRIVGPEILAAECGRLRKLALRAIAFSEHETLSLQELAGGTNQGLVELLSNQVIPAPVDERYDLTTGKLTVRQVERALAFNFKQVEANILRAWTKMFRTWSGTGQSRMFTRDPWPNLETMLWLPRTPDGRHHTDWKTKTGDRPRLPKPGDIDPLLDREAAEKLLLSAAPAANFVAWLTALGLTEFVPAAEAGKISVPWIFLTTYAAPVRDEERFIIDSGPHSGKPAIQLAPTLIRTLRQQGEVIKPVGEAPLIPPAGWGRARAPESERTG